LILLVGMHRSGTSLLGSLLPHLGVALPGDMFAGDIHNPEGYFERRDVTDLQEQLLIDLGRWWPSAAGVLPLPDGWMDWPCTRRAANQLGKLLADEAEQHQGPWAIKDPRSSLLLPLWKEICTDLTIPLMLVHAVRAPAEVMVSLLRRDANAAGMTPVRAQQLWWHHNIRILEDSGDMPRLVVSYSHWFQQQAQQQLSTLGHFCCGVPPSAEAQAAAYAEIRPEHRRSQSSGNLPMPIHRRLRQLERTLGASALKPSNPRHHIPPAPRWRGQLTLLPATTLPSRCRLEVVGYGATPCHWSIHAWLQRCPLPKGFQLSEEKSAEPVGLHLQSLALTQSSNALELLRQLPVVLDPVLERVEELRQQGVRAFWLDPGSPSSGWLDESFDADAASQLFGLPAPSLLSTHGDMLCLGGGGKSWEQIMPAGAWSLPTFDSLYVANAQAARLLAGWLNTCSRAGLQLVRLEPSDYEREGLPFSALDRPGRLHQDWLPPVLLKTPLEAEELVAELHWQRTGKPAPAPCQTPTPHFEVLWESGTAGARAAVCISLYNYADRVLSALESVRRQSLRPLELIVVDDSSSDGGEQRVSAWLREHSQVFQRAVLLRHTENGGLAAARNTAFAASEAEWCFVLDADNSLEPEAVALCLAIAECSPSTTAVVHPMVELRNESRVDGQPEQALLSHIPWQRQAMIGGNQIDAMALVRREHWHLVGGYTHIPGGWEDYDFWCKIIEAGLHGVICPQRLAVYNRHNSSMQARKTLSHLWSLKRILMSRHPWLQLDSPIHA
jgi:GT2 family glycosyltransferase